MLRKANTTTAKRPDLSGNLPPFFVQRAATAERIATAEKQLRDLAAQSESLLADPSTGPTLTADLSRLEGESQARGKMIASDRRRMEAMDKTEFAPAAQKLVSSLGTARAAVLAALAEAVSLRVSPWLMSGKGDLGDLKTQKGDLERLVNRSHLLTQAGRVARLWLKPEAGVFVSTGNDSLEKEALHLIGTRTIRQGLNRFRING